jgi:hypothetical protein
MPKAILTVPFSLMLLALPVMGQSTALRAPSSVSAGSSFSIATSGNGAATFYLLGPSHVVKRTIQLGQDLQILGSDVVVSGSYHAVACDSNGCANADFQVFPSSPARLSFLVHPSRVPVSAANAINATALVFDRFDNTVLERTNVEFHFSSAAGSTFERSVPTVRGVAWLQMGSTPKQGPLRVVASVGDTAEARIIQQVASEACGLRVQATSGSRMVMLRTEPVRDCGGNPLPDGTVVSFTKVDGAGRSTVDTPIKKGVASAQFAVTGRARISVACGVVLGNEISVGGQPR